MRRVLVTGATGETGRRVVDRLLARGDAVRALARSRARALERLPAEVEVFEGDVRTARSLDGLVEGIDAVVHTIGTRTYFGRNGGAAVDRQGTRLLSHVFRDSTVRHVVMLSAFGVGRRSPLLTAFSLALGGGYFGHKEAAERALHDCGVPLTIVRPVELRNRPARSGPLLNQTAPLSLLRTVSREVVADVLAACVEHPDAIGKTFELCEGGDAPLDDQLATLALDGEWAAPSRSPLFA